jgi:microcompartment protein CcmL/EutN
MNLLKIASRVAAAVPGDMDEVQKAIEAAVKNARTDEEIEYIKAYSKYTPKAEQSADSFWEYMDAFDR